MSEILVVDDNEKVRKRMTQILKSQGFSVSPASSDEALDLINSKNFDVIVTDMLMEHDKAGEDVLEAALKKNQETEVIVITAYTSVPGAVDTTKKGAFYYIDKDGENPYDILISKVKEALERKQTNKNKNVKIFISYAREDYSIAYKIYLLLKDNNYNPWIDKKKLLPGQNWNFEVEKAIKNSNFFIACLSNKSVTKEGYFQKELKKGLELFDRMPPGSIYLIPIRLDNCTLPRRFDKLQWCDVFKSDWPNQLLGSICEGTISRGICNLYADQE